MGVVSVRERWKGRGGKFCYTYIPSDTATRYFLIQTNAITDDLATVYTATSGITIPAGGSNFPGSGILTCRDVDYQNDDQSPFFWNVTASYSDAPIKPPINPNPLTRQAAISGDGRQYTKSVTHDWQGTLEVNSAGDPFDPHDIDDPRSIYQVEKNVAYNAVPSFANNYNNCVNSDLFTIAQLGLTFDAYTLKVSDFKFSDIKTEYVELVGIVQYRTLSFTLSPNYTQQNGQTIGWQFSPADRGFRAVYNGGASPGVSGTLTVGQAYRVKIYDQTAGYVYPKTAPLLDGSGQVQLMQSSALPVYAWTSPQGTSPPYDDFQPVDFSVLSAYCV